MPSLLHSNNSLVAEVVKLRKKYGSAMREREKLLIEISRLRLLEVKYREFMNMFEPLSSSLLSHLDGLAVFRSKIQDVVKLGRSCEIPKENKPVDQSGSPMKTMAVSPMINGHLLKKASISLQRVNLMAQGTANGGQGSVQWRREERHAMQRNLNSSHLTPIREDNLSSNSSPSFSQEAYQLHFNPVVPLQRLSLNQQNVAPSTSNETRSLQEEINTRIPVVRLQSLSLQSAPSEHENQSVLQSQTMVLLDRLQISSVTDSVNSTANLSVPRIENNEDVHEEEAVVTQEFTEANGTIFSNSSNTSVLESDTIEAVPEIQPLVSEQLGNSAEETSSLENTQEQTSSSMDEMRCDSMTSQENCGSILLNMENTTYQSDQSTTVISQKDSNITYLDLERTMGVLSFGTMDDHHRHFQWSHLQATTSSCSAEEQVPPNVVVPEVEVPIVQENSPSNSSSTMNEDGVTEENNQCPTPIIDRPRRRYTPNTNYKLSPCNNSSSSMNEDHGTEENNQCPTPIIDRPRRRCSRNINYKLSPINKKKRRE